MANPALGDRHRVTRTYRIVARAYDTLRPLFAGFERTRDEYFSHLELREDDRILDVGCGTGESLRRVAGAERDLHGVDLSPEQLHFARGKPALSSARLTLGDATRLPYRDDAFDVVMSVGSFPYVPDLDAALSEAYRVSRADGRLFVVGPKYPEGAIGRRVADRLLQFFEPAAFAERCRRAGWRDVETATVHMDWLFRDAVVATARV
ncbi:MAG: class I SAM-dependent methyltransferase [Halanaeroarchaeum sp.]